MGQSCDVKLRTQNSVLFVVAFNFFGAFGHRSLQIDSNEILLVPAMSSSEADSEMGYEDSDDLQNHFS